MAKPMPITSIGKLCTKCGDDKPLSEFYTSGKKTDGSFKYNSWCKPCVSTKMSSYHKRTWGREKLHYTAHKRTQNYRTYLSYLLAKARRRGECSITLDELCAIYNTQKGKCAITGWDMTMRLADGVIPTNISIDRIDSSMGYHAENIQLVCRCVNIAKHDLTSDEFVKLCKAVVERANNG